MVAELIEEGQLQPHEAEEHEENGVITRYIGMDERTHPWVRSLALEPGDWFLLCTDGLTDMVTEFQITEGLSEIKEPQAGCNGLVQMALDAGGHDNVTVMMIQWAGKG